MKTKFGKINREMFYKLACGKLEGKVIYKIIIAQLEKGKVIIRNDLGIVYRDLASAEAYINVLKIKDSRFA